MRSDEIVKSASAFDRDRKIQQGRCARLLKFAFDGGVDDLLDVRTAAATSQTRTRRARNISRRARAVFDESTNLSICDSVAMANEHRVSHLGFLRTSAVYFYRK